jgi:RNA polymerase sigma factor (sigma-70 family)
MPNTEKFLQVINDHKQIIYRVISIYCKDNDDKKDVEQEVLIQLWKSFEKYDQQFKYSTWIYKITMNVAITFYRMNEKKLNKTSSINDSIFNEIPNPIITENENSALLHSLIQQLNEFDREILVLYLEDYSQKEIAELVGISVTNVATKINRIKNKLKENSLKFNQEKHGIR